jgi:hypothetical protein
MVQLGLGPTDFNRLMATAPKRYKVYQIPKRNGGTRTIAHPSAELKLVQRYILANKLNQLPVHSAATGYVCQKGIRVNAEAHCKNRIILKLDFEAFFINLSVKDWLAYAKAADPNIINKADLPIYTQAMFWGVTGYRPICLSIGAPTSPALSNILMFGIDTLLADQAGALGVTYTRYADDITASGNDLDAIKAFEVAARQIVKRTRSPKLTFNEDKRGLYMKGQRRMVTGLIITPENKVSIGRERKRHISVLLHKAKIDEIDAERMAKLKGLLGFCIGVEPNFVDSMRVKYGSELVDRVLKHEILPRKQRAAIGG